MTEENQWHARRARVRSLHDVVQLLIAAAERRDGAAYDAHVLALEDLLRDNAGAARIRRMGELVERLHERGAHTACLSTGIRDLDAVTGGLRVGLNVVAGRPAMGKSALVAQIARHACIRLQRPVLYFAPDGGAEELALRMIAAEADIDLFCLRSAYIARHQWAPLADAAGALQNAPLFVDETAAPSVAHVRARIERQMAETDVGLVVIDAIDDIAQPVANVCAQLAQVARELHVPVLCVTRVGRGPEGRIERRPTLADVRDGGVLDQVADVILLLYRSEYYLREHTPEDRLGIAEIIVAKNKRGPTATIEARYFASSMRFGAAVSEEERRILDDDEPHRDRDRSKASRFT